MLSGVQEAKVPNEKIAAIKRYLTVFIIVSFSEVNNTSNLL